MLFMALALAAYAQPATDSGVTSSSQNSNLPLRNLQIEVRQVSRDNASDASANANTQQQVLVLNGRRASIALRNSRPFRLVQSFVVNGVMTVVAGTVLIEAGTGFDATARWDGSDLVEIELAASQGQGRYHTQTASTSTLVVVPLNEWVTVAQSDDDSSGNQASTGSQSQWRRRSATEVQVRVNAR